MIDFRKYRKCFFVFLICILIAGFFCASAVRSRGGESKAVNAQARQSALEKMGEEYQDVFKIALTFDDGPHPYYTEQLLDGLKKRGVKATFFITGMNAEEHPDIVKRISDEGHLIGNHTYSHMQLTNDNFRSFKEELLKTNDIIRDITGEDVFLVRPPYGVWNKKLETELNLFPVLWSIDPLDWCSSDVQRIISRVTAKADDNDIILMHDYYSTSVTAALAIIDELTEKGFVFVTVDEVLFD